MAPSSSPCEVRYGEYLKLDDLLRIQVSLSDSPDELHFIIIHQIHELWFKLALNQLERARDALIADRLAEGARLLTQAAEIFENMNTTTRHLHTLPPASFHIFRKFLSPASGMQSFQFREVEILAGRRDERFIESVRKTLGDDAVWPQVQARLEAPSLADAFNNLLERRGIGHAVEVYAQPERDPELYALAETLSAFDHRVIMWRYTHIQLIERTIGAGTMGTGGTTHDYLQRTVQVHFFPALWEARNELSRRTDISG